MRPRNLLIAYYLIGFSVATSLAVIEGFSGFLWMGYGLVCMLPTWVIQAQMGKVTSYLRDNYPDLYNQKKSSAIFEVWMYLYSLSRKDINTLGDKKIVEMIYLFRLQAKLMVASLFLFLLLIVPITNSDWLSHYSFQQKYSCFIAVGFSQRSSE